MLFQNYLNTQLSDAEFKQHFDTYGKQLEIAYEILKLRKTQKMSQKELAQKIGTTQSNVARMEAGHQNFSTLLRIAEAFDHDLKVSFVKS